MSFITEDTNSARDCLYHYNIPLVKKAHFMCALNVQHALTQTMNNMIKCCKQQLIIHSNG